jgi:uncharacterized protein YbaP (TraB family)
MTVCRAARNVALGGIWTLLGLCWLSLAAAAGAASESGLLFEVEGPSGKPSYLFGTIHSDDPRVVILPKPVQDAFDGAGVLVMEVIPDQAAIGRSVKAMLFHDGRCLKDVIGASLYAKTVAALKTRGLSEAAVQDFKPWAIITLLSLPQSKTGQFLDLRLYQDALAQGKPVPGLETMDEQLSIFEDLSERDQIALLRETLAVQREMPDVFERLIAAYLSRDLNELLRLSERYLQGGDSALAERFRAAALDRRNRRMAQRLIPLVRRGGYFVALGALHLPGKGGVLKRVMDSGFQVRALY